MEKKDIEDLIDLKILKEKLVIYEKRIIFLLAAFAGLSAIFGIIVPLFISSQNTDRVDAKIEEIDKKFQVLSQQKLLRPSLTLQRDDQEISENALFFEKGKIKPKYLVLKNTGNSVATNVRVMLYLPLIKKFPKADAPKKWITRQQFFSAEIDYPHVVHYNYFEYLSPKITFSGGAGPYRNEGGSETHGEVLERLDPLQAVKIFTSDLKSFLTRYRTYSKNGIVPAIFKIYYGQPEPKNLRVTIKFIKQSK